MSLLKDLEKKLESLFEGIFIKSFKSGVQPIELAKGLAREMEEHKIVSIARIYGPNKYTIYLSPMDKKLFQDSEKAILSEFQEFLLNQASKTGLALLGRPQIDIVVKDDFVLGQFKVEGRISSEIKEIVKEEGLSHGTRIIPAEERKKERERESLPLILGYLVQRGKNEEKIFPINKERVGIGRSEVNDIVLSDPGVSRNHAEIVVEKRATVIKDLGSTNGTFVNGKRVKKKLLRHKDKILLGTTNLEFRGTTRV